MAAEAINRVLDAIDVERAVHLCFGNYGGQTIQKGHWAALLDFLNRLHTHHLVLELAHRPVDDLEALKDVDKRITIGIGVIDIKVNHVETPDEVARRIETAEKKLGAGQSGLGPSRLRLLDAEALDRRSQDGSAGQGTGSLPWRVKARPRGRSGPRRCRGFAIA